MQSTIELSLLHPISGLPGHDGTPAQVSKIVLRAPRLREYAQIGDLDSFARTPEGSVYLTENEGVFDRYLDLLLVEPTSTAIARNISLADAIRLKDALRDFFIKSRATEKGEDKAPSGE